jgi:pimeloyl-ACP methyl ester carboxylesterase
MVRKGAVGMSRALVNNIELEYRDIGNPDDPAILLVMGFAAPMNLWPESLVQCLVSKGLRVILFDNRDAGLSQKMEGSKEPSLLWAIVKNRLGLPIESTYTLEDMADDVMALADDLGIEKFHLMGASMGGMISQVLTCRDEDRVLSLTSIMSTNGSRASGTTELRAVRKLAGLCVKRGSSEEYRQALMDIFQFINESPVRMEEEDIREIVDHMISCDYQATAAKRQCLAMLRARDRTKQLQEVRTPTLVLHGTHDRLLSLEHAVSTARCIPNAKLEILEGFGHTLPESFGDRVGRIVGDHVFAATA